MKHRGPPRTIPTPGIGSTTVATGLSITAGHQKPNSVSAELHGCKGFLLALLLPAFNCAPLISYRRESVEALVDGSYVTDARFGIQRFFQTIDAYLVKNMRLRFCKIGRAHV